MLVDKKLPIKKLGRPGQVLWAMGWDCVALQCLHFYCVALHICVFGRWNALRGSLHRRTSLGTRGKFSWTIFYCKGQFLKFVAHDYLLIFDWLLGMRKLAEPRQIERHLQRKSHWVENWHPFWSQIISWRRWVRFRTLAKRILRIFADKTSIRRDAWIWGGFLEWYLARDGR